MTKVVNSIIGFILGTLVAYYFLRIKALHGPNSKDVKRRIYEDSSGNCYRLQPKVYICPINRSMS